MCTLIVTVRCVLWYVISLAGTLLILGSLLTDKWLEGQLRPSSVASPDVAIDTLVGAFNTIVSDKDKNVFHKHVGLFMACKNLQEEKMFDGECVPDLSYLEKVFNELDDDKYPHAWRGTVICFGVGLVVMAFTEALAILTICCRDCLCCSVFIVCSSLQTFASTLLGLGVIAYPAGWGSKAISDGFCGGHSSPFILGDVCTIGAGYWVAVAGTLCCFVASSLAICAHQSTRSTRCENKMASGQKCICLP